jgi:DNA-binding GntR family transcriptional regulator
VREYNAEIVTQMNKLRGSLERHSVEALADKPLDELIVALKEANEKMAAFFKANNIEEYLAANLALHDLILRRAGNEPLQGRLRSSTRWYNLSDMRCCRGS